MRAQTPPTYLFCYHPLDFSSPLHSFTHKLSDILNKTPRAHCQPLKQCENRSEDVKKISPPAQAGPHCHGLASTASGRIRTLIHTSPSMLTKLDRNGCLLICISDDKWTEQKNKYCNKILIRIRNKQDQLISSYKIFKHKKIYLYFFVLIVITT